MIYYVKSNSSEQESTMCASYDAACTLIEELFFELGENEIIITDEQGNTWSPKIELKFMECSKDNSEEINGFATH